MQKNEIPRSRVYLDYIRSMPCLITKSEHEIVAHHVHIFKDGGMGIKPSDFRTVPLTPLEHQRLHQMGERSYWAKKNIDVEIVIIVLLCSFAKLDATKLLCTSNTHVDIIKGLERYIMEGKIRG